jgi:hypothetical protein
MWDIEVDVACVGAGPGTLASAVASVDAGVSVFLATPDLQRREGRSNLTVQERVRGFLGSWARADMDDETGRYLSALTEDFRAPGAVDRAPALPVRTVSAVRNDGAVKTFVGSKLGAWQSTCLASPYGMLFTNVSGWRTAPMRTEDGQSVEVQHVASVSRAELADGFDATEWLQAQADSRDIRDHRFTDLERIVFDGGRIVGIELVTPDGVLAVGVRHGLSLTSSDSALTPPVVAPVGTDDLQLCLVGQAASRFLRVELLGTALQERPLCTASGRQLHAALRDSRPFRSGAGRCGKLR